MEYTQEAKDAGIEGTVLLSIVVSSEGVPTDLRVMRSTLKNKNTGQAVEKDPGLEQKAVEAVSQWRFKPGIKDGKPVAVRANVEVNFRLQ